MKNNKSYYSWIHSLKNAAVEVQHNHAKILSEATHNPTISGESGLKQGTTRIHGKSRPGAEGSAQEELAGNIALGLFRLLQRVNETKPNEGVSFKPLNYKSDTAIRNIANAARGIASGNRSSVEDSFEPLDDGGDPEPVTPDQYRAIANLEAQRLNATPMRTAGSEDTGSGLKSSNKQTAGKTAALRARSTAKRGHLTPDPVLVDPLAKVVTTKFVNPMTARARIEAGFPALGDVALARKDLIPTQADLDDNGVVGDAGDVAADVQDGIRDNRRAQRNESVEHTIRKLLNG